MSENKTVSHRLYDILRDIFRRRRQHLIGQLLTITDGLGQDAVQRKALKNLVEDAVWRFSDHMEDTFVEYCRLLSKTLKEPADSIPDRFDKPAASVVESEFNPLTD